MENTSPEKVKFTNYCSSIPDFEWANIMHEIFILFNTYENTTYYIPIIQDIPKNCLDMLLPLALEILITGKKPISFTVIWYVITLVLFFMIILTIRLKEVLSLR